MQPVFLGHAIRRARDAMRYGMEKLTRDKECGPVDQCVKEFRRIPVSASVCASCGGREQFELTFLRVGWICVAQVAAQGCDGVSGCL